MSSVSIFGRRFDLRWFDRLSLNGEPSHFSSDSVTSTITLSRSMTTRQAFVAGVCVAEAIHGERDEIPVDPQSSVSARF